MSHEVPHGLDERPNLSLLEPPGLLPMFLSQPHSEPAAVRSSGGDQQASPSHHAANYAAFAAGVPPFDADQRTIITKAPSAAAPVGFTAIGAAGRGPVTFQAPAVRQPARAPQAAAPPPAPQIRRERQVG